ncbi:small G protein signaling modulator 2-like isoform X2 [Homalodisca vitripennis]|uniref:small G protein signaling modulator 2-like isoform X2 n=1 Tax=Homalodisca vitripennis TaxID=197043 RepID=UPI001EEB92EC|nr:small G protein signaling modulator 2-like isoform X2 [Homalodisca vitripennis]
MLHLSMDMSSSDKKLKEKLIEHVTKEVKQIMEEAVTRKFVHEDSSKVTSLCGAVEACLSQGLRRRALGLFKTSSTTALLHKVGKNFEPADLISKKVREIENADPNRRSSSSGDSMNRIPTASILTNSSSFTKPPLQKKNSSGSGLTATCQTPKYLWIRLALFEKVLARIIDHLVQNSSKYYEKDSLVADPEYGSILSSLLVGPCALDYSKTKTQDHFWTDPPADELVQRHRISSGVSTHLSCPRPVLNYRRSLHAVSSEEGRQTPTCAKDYVESLHQNSKATLLYGKNNVLVIPKDLTEPMPGYLSLHQTAHSLTIKWTPNQLMNGYPDAEKQDNKNGDRRFSLPANNVYTQPRIHKALQFRRSSTKTQMVMYWDCAMNVRVNEIVYVHCHQQGDSGGTIVLVGQDGVQRPPIHFPGGGHLLAFLSCLENGLLPHGQLDPPLWSQRGKGKVFPKLRRKGRGLPNSCENSSDESTDYVFQIINKTRHEDYLMGSNQELLDPRNWLPHTPRTAPASPAPHTRAHLLSSSTSSTSSSKSFCNGEMDMVPVVLPPAPHSAPPIDSSHRISTGDSIQLLCNTMKKQIISRAFYGWLAYCRHLSTVRKHLSGLFNPNIVDGEGAEGGLTREVWEQLVNSGEEKDKIQIFRLTYYGGVNHEIRKEVWPYLLGHYQFGSTAEEREELDKSCRQNYETTMSEWLAVEAIVRQRDKEMMAANLAKLSSESTSGGDVPPQTPTTGGLDLSNDVFVSLNSDDEDDEDDDEDEDDDHNEGLIVDDSNIEDAAENNDDNQSKTLKYPVVKDVPKCPPNSLEKYSSSDIENSSSDPVVLSSTLGAVEEASQDPSGLPHHQRSESPDEGMGDEVDEDPHENNHDRCPPMPGGNSQAVAMAVIVTTNQSLDSGSQSESNVGCQGRSEADGTEGVASGEVDQAKLEVLEESFYQGSRSNCVSPASSQGGVYSKDLLETFGLNLHRIDKDVQRCDRNYWYFTVDNLEKLRNVMCTYVWEHLKLGYMQGMCDLVAPLLVIFDDESITYSCFCLLMERMGANFPHKGGAMDTHFANMRSLIQIMDSEMFELMHQNGDYTHFYFCYRWFLLDFKRELLYEDVFSVWETIWAAKHISSAHFMLFIALALVESYRDIILSNSMDFTDIIKFFNEMAERHNAKSILSLARYLVLQLQMLIENK